MSFSAARPLTPWQWLGIPTLLSLAGLMLFAAPLSLQGWRLPTPIFPLGCAFAWALIRPSLLAPFVLLAMGLLLDLYWGGTLGVWTFSLLVAYGLCLFCRSLISGQGGVIGFLWYAGACALAMGSAVSITALIQKAAPGPLPLLGQFLATLVLYPLAHRLIERFEDADVRFR